MRKLFVFILSIIYTVQLKSQSLYFPPINNANWDTTKPETLGWCTNKLNALYDYLGTENSKAFIVLKDGKIVLEKYFGTFTQDSLWYWASAGKSLTSFLVGIAQQEGKLSISDISSKYIGTGWTSESLQKEGLITVRNQLTMTTGLDDAVADPYCTLSSCLIYKADAGNRWAYHNGPYTLLDKVIEGATGQNINQYFANKVKTVTGMKGAYFPQGYNNVMISDARSFARFGLLMLNKGKWNNTSILTDMNYYTAMINSSQSYNPSYGYLWWLNGKSKLMVPQSQIVFNTSFSPDAPIDMFAALGKNGQILCVVPSKNLVVLRMGDASNTGEVPFTLCNNIWIKLNDVICTSLASSFQIFSAQYNQEKSKVDLNWEISNENIGDYYWVQNSTDGILFSNQFSIHATNNPNINKYQVSLNLYDTKLAYYRIAKYSNQGDVTYSAVQKINIPNNDEKIFIEFFPNPAKNLITIKGISIKDIQIFNIDGKCMVTQRINNLSNQISIPINHLSNGEYWVKCTTVTGKYYQKLLIIHK